VRESLHERGLMLRLAPTLVQLQKFYIPVYRHTRRRPWQLRIGLSLYALLAGLDASAHFGTVAAPPVGAARMVSRRRISSRCSGITTRRPTNASLTAAVMRSAQSLGAELALAGAVPGATLGQDAVRVRYRHAGAEQECEAGVLVNAAGAWAGTLAQSIEPKTAVPALELVQGSHLVYEGAPQAGVYYVESPRRRPGNIRDALAAGKLLVGTTEVRFRGDPATVAPGAHEVHYLQEVLRHYFPRFRDAALRAAGGGASRVLRVLPAGEGHAFHRRARHC